MVKMFPLILVAVICITTLNARLCEQYARLTCEEESVEPQETPAKTPESKPNGMDMDAGNNTENKKITRKTDVENKVIDKVDKEENSTDNVEAPTEPPPEALTGTPPEAPESYTDTEAPATSNPQEDVTEEKQIEPNGESKSQGENYWFATMASFAIICSTMSLVAVLSTMTCWKASRRQNAQFVQKPEEGAETSRPRLDTPSPPPWPTPPSSPPTPHERAYLDPIAEEAVYIDLQAMERMLEKCRVVARA